MAWEKIPFIEKEFVGALLLNGEDNGISEGRNEMDILGPGLLRSEFA
jgi:hypothetical protein